MKKQIMVAILSLSILGIWGNTALAAKAQSDQVNSGVMMVQQKKDFPKPLKEKNEKKGMRYIKEVEREFNDVQKDWSREEVLEASAKGFVNGYEDFSFRPNAPVSKMETLTLILNAQGLGEEAKNYVLSDEQKVLLAKIPDWGKNYIAVALDKGILTKEELQKFNPQQGAKRYEVCMYMCRILNNAETAVQNSDNQVFTDENQIPAVNKKDVRLMWSKGVVKGYPDGCFNPMRVVKRNEIVTMLNKLDDNCLQSFASSTVKGTIKEIKAIEGGYAISVQNDKGETVMVNTTAKTKLIYEGHLLGMTIDLSGSEKVKILLNQDKEAVLVRILAGEKVTENQNDQEDANTDSSIIVLVDPDAVPANNNTENQTE